MASAGPKPWTLDERGLPGRRVGLRGKEMVLHVKEEALEVLVVREHGAVEPQRGAEEGPPAVEPLDAATAGATAAAASASGGHVDSEVVGRELGADGQAQLACLHLIQAQQRAPREADGLGHGRLVAGLGVYGRWAKVGRLSHPADAGASSKAAKAKKPDLCR